MRQNTGLLGLLVRLAAAVALVVVLAGFLWR